jgi:hypothetical protein
MRRLGFCALAMGLAACGGADAGAACARFVEEVDECFAIAGGESTLEDNFCTPYAASSGSEARGWKDYFDCAEALVRRSDCSTMADANNALASASECL